MCREEVLCQNPNNYKHLVQKAVIGASVLTRYNNRMYRIDDIDFDKSPRSTFATHGGEDVSTMMLWGAFYVNTGTIEYLPLVSIIL
jgi:hypothetical protein